MVVFLNSLYYLFHILRRLELNGPRVDEMAQKYAQARFSLCFHSAFSWIFTCTQYLMDISGFFSNIVPTQSKNMKYDHCSLSFYKGIKFFPDFSIILLHQTSLCSLLARTELFSHSK